MLLDLYHIADPQGGTVNKLELLLEKVIFAGRWLLAPLYLGLLERGILDKRLGIFYH